MKEDVVAANLANLRQSINELKECIEKQNATVPKPEQSVKADFNEKAIYTGIAKSFCTCWNEALSVVKKHIWQQQPDRLPFSLWFPKLIDLFKQKSTLLEYLYRHVCDYNQNCMTIETIPPNISGLFICGYHIKLQYIVPIIAVIIIWAVAASASSMKFKEESFEHYSMYRAVKEQYQHLVEITYVKSKPDAE